MKFIAALNSLNTPWIAILVIVLGMGYAVVSHVYGLSGDGASGVIGAGIGLLTGQALAKSSQSAEPMALPKNPITPVEPA
jgi:hypothetical protein